jgi:Uma2 family endonuclease
MLTVTEATIEDLYLEEGKAELVNGEIVRFMATGDEPGRAGGIIYAMLFFYERVAGGGRAYPDNVGFLVDLPHRKSFSPDAAWHTGPRAGMKFLNGAPAFAAEVRSENDYGPAAEREMAAKRDDYFAVGTLVVWDVDLLNEYVVRVYRYNERIPTLYRRGEIAEAEPAVPGWTMPVDDLFS